MRLGSALDVIRYNQGFGGIQKLSQALGIEMSEVFQKFVQVESREVIPSIRRQRRGTKRNRTGLRKKLQRLRNTGRVTSLGFTPLLQSCPGALLPRL